MSPDQATSADPPAGSASAEPTAERGTLASFDDAIRDDAPAAANADADAYGSPPAPSKPAPPGDVRSGGRRSRNAAENAQTIESLRAELETARTQADPEALRAQVRAELAAEAERERADQAQAALGTAEQQDAERFHHLNALPDDAPELNVGDNYAWLQDQKRKLALFPEVSRRAQALARRDAEQARAALEQRDAGFWHDVRSQISSSAQRHGIDPKSWTEQGYTWDRMADDIASARERAVRAELEPKLEQALARARAAEAGQSQYGVNGRAGLAAARRPAAPGRSSAPGPARPDWKTASAGDLFEAAILADQERTASRGR